MNIDDILLDLKRKIQSDITNEELDKCVFIGECLVKLKAFENMYAEDLNRLNSYYSECEKSFDYTKELLGDE